MDKTRPQFEHHKRHLTQAAMSNPNIVEASKALLKKLIATPSFSGEENETARHIAHTLESFGASPFRHLNNVWCKSALFDPAKPTVLLNSHHDTVRPASGYTNDPFEPIEKDGKLYGLGSNDAGGALVSLLAVFLHFKNEVLPYNLLFAASAEEENSGKNGVEALLHELPTVDLAIVGEPTEMKLAVAEKGLLVLDGLAEGRAGHAARNEGENAIYKALKDVEWLRTFEFPNISETLGKVNVNVTQINAGYQHNVVPDKCEFVVDVRVTDAYTLQEVLQIIKDNTKSKITPRSVRLNSSGIPGEHPVKKAADKLGIPGFGSPTLSDQALMPFASVKIGPGKSERSHTADEYIYLKEIEEGVELYIELLKELKPDKK